MNRVFALVNPIVVALAQSFLHGLISHQVVVLEFKGRRSGRGYALPVSFVRNDGEVFCMTDRKGIWWRNLQGAVPVQLTLAGRTVQATACVEVDDEQQIGAALRLFCLRSRISAFFTFRAPVTASIAMLSAMSVRSGLSSGTWLRLRGLETA